MTQATPPRGARPDDPRRADVRAYEDAYCQFADGFGDRVKALRTSPPPAGATGDAQALVREHEAWVAAHPAPEGLMPPARPGEFLDPSGLQPTARMYYCGFAHARMVLRLRAFAGGGPPSVLDHVDGEPAGAAEHLAAQWALYETRKQGNRK